MNQDPPFIALLTEEAPPVDPRRKKNIFCLLPDASDKKSDLGMLVEELRLDIEPDLLAGLTSTPASTVIDLGRLPTWPRLIELTPEELAAVLLQLCRDLLFEGCRRAFYEAPSKTETDSPNAKVRFPSGQYMDGWAFLHTSPSDQARLLPNNDERERILSLLQRDAAPPPPADANGWRIVVEIL